MEDPENSRKARGRKENVVRTLSPSRWRGTQGLSEKNQGEVKGEAIELVKAIHDWRLGEKEELNEAG